MLHTESHLHAHKRAGTDNSIAVDRCSGVTPTRVRPSHPFPVVSTLV